jgi:hypothetical protein
MLPVGGVLGEALTGMREGGGVEGPPEPERVRAGATKRSSPDQGLRKRLGREEEEADDEVEARGGRGPCGNADSAIAIETRGEGIRASTPGAEGGQGRSADASTAAGVLTDGGTAPEQYLWSALTRRLTQEERHGQGFASDHIGAARSASELVYRARPITVWLGMTKSPTSLPARAKATASTAQGSPGWSRTAPRTRRTLPCHLGRAHRLPVACGRADRAAAGRRCDG